MRDFKTIKWTYRFAECPEQEREVEVLIDLQLFDEKWKESDQYVRPGCDDDPESIRRYRGFGEFIETALCVHMPEAGIDGGIPEFADGRHRFAWLRDHGLKVMPIAVERERKAEFEQLFGSRKL